jgi:hypothetical protein
MTAPLRTVKSSAAALAAGLDLCEPWALSMPPDAEPVAFTLEVSPWPVDDDLLLIALVTAHIPDAPPGLEMPSSVLRRELDSGFGRVYLYALGFEMSLLEAMCVYAIVDRSPGSHLPGDEVRLPVYSAPINDLERDRDGEREDDPRPLLALIGSLLREAAVTITVENRPEVRR